MYTLIRVLPMNELMRKQLPAFAVALVIAEIFYKFHSFLLETGAFLLTWFVLDLLITGVANAFAKGAQDKEVRNENL